MMNNNNFAQQIFELNGYLEKLPLTFNKAKNSLLKHDDRSFETALVYGATKLESAAIMARKMVNTAATVNNTGMLDDKVMRSIADNAHGIKISAYENDILRVELPCTLPHYRERAKTILAEPLRFALKDYKKNGGAFPKYTSVILVCVNHISRKMSQGQIRDNDNYDYKCIVNTLTYWLLSDDNYNCCSMLNGTKLSGDDKTEIFVVPKEKFAGWFAKHADILD